MNSVYYCLNLSLLLLNKFVRNRAAGNPVVPFILNRKVYFLKRRSATISQDKVPRSFPLGQLCSFIFPWAPAHATFLSISAGKGNWSVARSSSSQNFYLLKLCFLVLPHWAPWDLGRALRFSGPTEITSVGTETENIMSESGAWTFFLNFDYSCLDDLTVRILDLAVLIGLSF